MADIDAAIEIHTTSANLRATADYTPSEGAGELLTVGTVLEKLSELGITHGIQMDAIKYVCESTRSLKAVVIAEAVAPGVGENARIEQYVSISKRSKAVEREDGSVDYRDLGEITSVSKGQNLFRRIPPTVGAPGIDITGTEIPGLLGKDIKVIPGNGTAFDESDPDLVVAVAEGELIFKGGVLHVSEIHDVKGDVDYSSGNLKFLGSIRIKGSVKAGFTVEAGGSVQVNGNVEDATIIAGSDITVMGGFAGTGQGLIQASRDVFIKFVENQRVEAGRDIILNGISYHSILRAGRSILAKCSNGTIVGGTAEAKFAVEACRFGSVACVPTTIRVGIDPTLAERMKAIDEEIAQTQESHDKLEQSVIYLYKMKIDRGGQLPPDKAALLQKLELVRKGIPDRLERLKEQKQSLLQEQENVEKASAQADASVFPKVRVYIGNQWVGNEDTLGPSVYRIFEGDIIRLSK